MHSLPVGAGGGVIVTDRDGIGVATLTASKGREKALAVAARGLRIELPHGPRRAAAGDLALIGTGPETWLATHERGSDGLAHALDPLRSSAAVVDQGSGYAVLRVSGSKARDALAKLIPIDLHPRVFAVGAAASTVAAHLGVTLWRLDDGPEGATFEIAMYRSYAASFWHALSEGAAEFGLAAGTT
jgi:sarcosine oxidase subunit gamma